MEEHRRGPWTAEEASERQKERQFYSFAPLLTNPQFCHWQSPTGQWWKETNLLLTIRGPRPYSLFYLKIIVPLYSLSGPLFLYLSQDKVRF